jgi:hypothetical protein
MRNIYQVGDSALAEEALSRALSLPTKKAKTNEQTELALQIDKEKRPKKKIKWSGA